MFVWLCIVETPKLGVSTICASRCENENIVIENKKTRWNEGKEIFTKNVCMIVHCRDAQIGRLYKLGVSTEFYVNQRNR